MDPNNFCTKQSPHLTSRFLFLTRQSSNTTTLLRAQKPRLNNLKTSQLTINTISNNIWQNLIFHIFSMVKYYYRTQTEHPSVEKINNKKLSKGDSYYKHHMHTVFILQASNAYGTQHENWISNLSAHECMYKLKDLSFLQCHPTPSSLPHGEAQPPGFCIHRMQTVLIPFHPVVCIVFAISFGHELQTSASSASTTACTCWLLISQPRLGTRTKERQFDLPSRTEGHAMNDELSGGNFFEKSYK